MTTMPIKRDEDRDGEVGEAAVAFTLTKPVDPALLDTELSEKMGWRKDGGIVVDGDVSTASASEPVTLWVMREDVDAKALQSVVVAHEVPEPAEDPIERLRDKAREGGKFTSEEVQQVLRWALLRP